MRALLAALVVLLGAATVGVLASAFIVDQNQHALVLRFGELKSSISEPGLNWKLPFVDNVEYFDKRILDLDTNEQESTVFGQQRVVVDAFSRYRIVDPLRFYQNVRQQARVKSVLGPLVSSAINRVLGTATQQEVVKDKREALMKEITRQVNEEAKEYGIQVVDVRLRRVDLPKKNQESVFNRMRQDRVQQATDLRAQGEAEKIRISADADRQVVVLKADAGRKSEEIRGDGDGERNRIFADAYNRDPEFFSFYRSMLAYEASLSAKDTRLVISPNSEFFRYFQDPGASKK